MYIFPSSHLTPCQVSCPSLSAIVGSFVGAALTPSLGRKSILVFCQFPMTATWVTFAYGDHFNYFLASAVLNGLSSGAALAVGQLYLIEISATKTRGFIAGKTLLWIVFYNLVNYVLGAFVSWQWLARINGLIQLIYLVMTWVLIPESPTWLLSQGREKEAMKSLKFLGRSSELR